MQISKSHISALVAQCQPTESHYLRLGDDVLIHHDQNKNRVIVRLMQGSIAGVVRLFWNTQAECFEMEDFGEPIPDAIHAYLIA